MSAHSFDTRGLDQNFGPLGTFEIHGYTPTAVSPDVSSIPRATLAA